MTGGALDKRRETLVRISAALASRDPDGLEGALREGAETGIAGEVEEVILQAYLFLGYPAALDAFGRWREISGQEAGEGVQDDWAAWSDRGKEVCRAVYAGQYAGLRRNVRELHPDMERWMVVEGYGKVLGRPGLDLPTRELCIAALLAVLQAPRQLYSHLRGALNAGASPEDVEAALVVASSLMDSGGAEAAQMVWERVQSRPVELAPNVPGFSR